MKISTTCQIARALGKKEGTQLLLNPLHLKERQCSSSKKLSLVHQEFSIKLESMMTSSPNQWRMKPAGIELNLRFLTAEIP